MKLNPSASSNGGDDDDDAARRAATARVLMVSTCMADRIGRRTGRWQLVCWSRRGDGRRWRWAVWSGDGKTRSLCRISNFLTRGSSEITLVWRESSPYHVVLAGKFFEPSSPSPFTFVFIAFNNSMTIINAVDVSILNISSLMEHWINIIDLHDIISTRCM